MKSCSLKTSVLRDWTAKHLWLLMCLCLRGACGGISKCKVHWLTAHTSPETLSGGPANLRWAVLLKNTKNGYKMKNIYLKTNDTQLEGEVQGFSCFVLLLSCFTDDTDVLQDKMREAVSRNCSTIKQMHVIMSNCLYLNHKGATYV